VISLATGLVVGADRDLCGYIVVADGPFQGLKTKVDQKVGRFDFAGAPFAKAGFESDSFNFRVADSFDGKEITVPTVTVN
jgi:hypothetical protein